VTTTAFPTSDADIRALKVKILRALGAAKYPAQVIGSVAGNNNLTVDDVKAMVANHGWPDPQEMRRHAFELEGGNETSPRRPAPATATTAPAGGSAAVDEGRTILRLLTAGEKSEKARTRKLAGKIREQLNDLRDLVIVERKEREAAAEAAGERARLKAEVEDLERQLAEKRAKLRPAGAASSTTPSGNAAKIRAWAAKHSVACPAFGRVPRDVVEAYELANGGA